MIFGVDGCMMVFFMVKVCELGNIDEKLVVLFCMIVVYIGWYWVEGDWFVMKVDVCWNEVWNGME